MENKDHNYNVYISAAIAKMKEVRMSLLSLRKIMMASQTPDSVEQLKLTEKIENINFSIKLLETSISKALLAKDEIEDSDSKVEEELPIID